MIFPKLMSFVGYALMPGPGTVLILVSRLYQAIYFLDLFGQFSINPHPLILKSEHFTAATEAKIFSECTLNLSE